MLKMTLFPIMCLNISRSVLRRALGQYKDALSRFAPIESIVGRDPSRSSRVSQDVPPTPDAS